MTVVEQGNDLLAAAASLALLMDEDSFTEIESTGRSGAPEMVTGWGKVFGRTVFGYARDVDSASDDVRPIHKIMDMAEAIGAPIVGIDVGTADPTVVRRSAVIPQITVAVQDGPLTARVSGVALGEYPDARGCCTDVRQLLSLLPGNNRERPPFRDSADPADRRVDRLADVVPADLDVGYDMRMVIEHVVDDGRFVEPPVGAHLVCALARVGGHAVGFVGNQPLPSGAFDVDTSESAATFVRLCDTFRIPLVALVDVPGFLPGAQLWHAYATARVPRIRLVLRDAADAGHADTDGSAMGADISLTWLRDGIADATRRYPVVRPGLTDAVIDPGTTRSRLSWALRMFRTRQRNRVR